MSLVGREPVMGAAEAAWAGARAGSGRLLLLAGEAGIGKTSVATAVADRARQDGAVLRWGASWEGQSVLPLGIWVDALRHPGADACAGMAARLEAGEFDAVGDTDAGRGFVRFCAGVVDSLREACAQAPQVLVLEDLHWADPLSRRLLAAVAAQLPRMALLILATYRDDELPDDPHLAVIGGAAERLLLTGLDEAAIAVLLAEVLGRDPEPDEVVAVRRDTAGNPLFAIEAGRLLAAGSATALPSGVHGVLARRLGRLSTHCYEVLGAAAVLGTDFTLPSLVALCGPDDAAVADALDEARRARLVQTSPDGSSLCFVHALVRGARYAALGTAQRAGLHRRAVEVLSGSAPGVLAHHAARGAFDPDDPRCAEVLVAAARDALARLAVEEAASLAEQAEAAAPSGVDGELLRAAACAVIGHARVRQDDAAGAAQAFGAMAAIGRGLRRPELIAEAALGFAAGMGSFEVRVLDRRQVDLLEEAAQLLPSQAPLRPLVLARLSVALAFVGSEQRRLELATAAEAAAEQRRDDRARAAAIAARCDAIAGPEHVAERLVAAGQVVDLAARAGDLPLELLGRRLRVVALLERRDLASLDVERQAFARTAQQLADPLFAWYVPMWAAARALADGDLAGASRLAEQAEQTGRGAGSVNAGLLCCTQAAFIAISRRDAVAFDRTWERLVTLHPEFVSIFAVPTLAMAHAVCGRGEQARALLDRSGAAVLDALPRDQEWLTATAQLIQAASVVDHEPLMARLYAQLLPFAGLGVFEGHAAVDHGVTDRYLAVAASWLGQADAARAHARAALDGVAGAGRLLSADTAEDCARALARGTGDDRTWAAQLAGVAARQLRELGLVERADELVRGFDATVAAPGVDRAAVAAAAPTLCRDGETWVFTYAGRPARVRDAKGVRDLAQLLARPGRDIHVRELNPSAPPAGAGAADPLLDDTAIARYRARLRELEEELDQADRHADVGRATKVAAERDALVDELARAIGPGGRRRGAGPDPDERLRKAVSARVKASIERLAQLHPDLGRHLRVSVHTGYWCRYEPETPMPWTVTYS